MKYTQAGIDRYKRDFAQRLRGELARPTELLRGRPNPKGSIAWASRNDAKVSACYVMEYKYPCGPVWEYWPWVLRVKINTGFELELSEQAKLRLLGTKPLVKAAWWLELSVLPAELINFVPWVAQFVEANETQDAGLIIAPPHKIAGMPCPVPLGVSYLWTEAAKEACRIAQRGD